MAYNVHQFLKGPKPGDIPIYQPTKLRALDQPNFRTTTFGSTTPGLARTIWEHLDCRVVNFLTTTAAASAAASVSVSLSGQFITTRLTCQIS
jgi:hypothetical protein